MIQIQYLPSAEQDYENIFHYIFSQSYSFHVAEKFLQKIRTQIEVLSLFPQFGINLGCKLNYQELYVFYLNGYSIYYVFDKKEDIIFIVHIKNNKQNLLFDV